MGQRTVQLVLYFGCSTKPGYAKVELQLILISVLSELDL